MVPVHSYLCIDLGRTEKYFKMHRASILLMQYSSSSAKFLVRQSEFELVSHVIVYNVRLNYVSTQNDLIHVFFCNEVVVLSLYLKFRLLIYGCFSNRL